MGMQKARQGTLSSINITPLTDVLLVLLITFLLTATSFEGHRSDLPLPQVMEVQQIAESMTVVDLTRSGEVVFPTPPSTAERPGESLALDDRFAALQRISEHKTLGLAVHRDVPYERLYQVMLVAESAGWEKIVLLTEASP